MQPDPQHEPELPPGEDAERTREMMRGMQLAKAGQLDEAASIAKDLIALHPSRPAGPRLMAIVCERRGDDVEGIAWIDQALRLAPKALTLIGIRARLCFHAGRAAEAIEAAEQIPEQSPLYPAARWWRALSLERLQRFDEAWTELEHLRTLPNPSSGLELLAARLQTRRGDPEAARQTLERLLTRTALTQRETIGAQFDLSNVCDRLGDYDAAFAAAQAANASRGVTFDAKAWKHQTDALIAYFTPECFAQLPRSEETTEGPVFIVGMPRSGTSLTEQIIEAHPSVTGFGEQKGPLRLAQQFETHTHAPFPQCLAAVTSDSLTNGARGILETFGVTVTDTERHTHKPLGLDRITGFLPMIFPNARVIFVRRRPLDNLLSIFMHLLRAERHPWSTSLEGLIVARRDHDRLIDHWKQVLPARWIELEYETLVSDQETTTRLLLDFLGLPWNQRCLDFQQSGRVTMTPSSDQVRQRLYTSAVERWRNYASHLGPLIEAFPPSPAD